ncbi:MAG: ABC transporter permease [Caldilineaceae bacterium]|nr:ABC transporter permease [Caldilineaceae bacterium]
MTVEHTTAVTPPDALGAIAKKIATWRMIPMIVLNEVYKGLLIQWSYKFNMLMESLMLAFLFLGITFFVGNGQLDPERLAPSLLGYAVWFYATVAIGTMAYALREEAQQGTLEQWYMSPVPPSVVQVGRTLSTFVVTTVTLLLIVVPLAWGFGLAIPWRWSVLPIFVLILIGVYGFGFLVGGATLIFKQVGPLANMVQNMMLFLNGAFLPVERFPRWLEGIAHTLPTTDGILVLQRLLFADESLWALWQDGSLVRLLLNSAVYLVLGLMVFIFTERLAKRRGLLGQY